MGIFHPKILAENPNPAGFGFFALFRVPTGSARWTPKGVLKKTLWFYPARPPRFRVTPVMAGSTQHIAPLLPGVLCELCCDPEVGCAPDICRMRFVRCKPPPGVHWDCNERGQEQPGCWCGRSTEIWDLSGRPGPNSPMRAGHGERSCFLLGGRIIPCGGPLPQGTSGHTIDVCIRPPHPGE